MGGEGAALGNMTHVVPGCPCCVLGAPCVCFKLALVCTCFLREVCLCHTPSLPLVPRPIAGGVTLGVGEGRAFLA